MYNKIKDILVSNNIYYEQYNHQPILTFEKVKEVKNKLKYTGIESKSLFIKDKHKNYYIFVTIENKMLNPKVIKNILGKKVSLCSETEVREIAKCIPGCVAPFGYDKHISIIVDNEI